MLKYSTQAVESFMPGIIYQQLAAKASQLVIYTVRKPRKLQNV